MSEVDPSKAGFTLPVPSTRTVAVIIAGIIILALIAVQSGTNLDLKFWGAEASVGRKASNSKPEVVTGDDKEALEKLASLSGPVSKENHNFRDITDPDTILSLTHI